tara:strand:- start:34 stop:846 length:813 start_codon:yes stop_codon:yes gene_type:complete
MQLLLENWRTFQARESLLSNPEYVSRVLGIQIPLQESYPYSILLTEEILQEQLILEGWIESVKGFIADKAKPYKDFFTTLTQVIQDPSKLKGFLGMMNKNMRRTMIRPVKAALDILKSMGVPTPGQMFEKLVSAYEGMQESWRKGLVGAALYVVVGKVRDTLKKLNLASVIDAIKGKSAEEVQAILKKLPAVQKIKEFFLSKAKELIGPELLKKVATSAADVKKWLGVIGPIVGGTEIVIQGLSPMTGKYQYLGDFSAGIEALGTPPPRR